MNIAEFFLGLASGMILLLVGQRVIVAYEARAQRQKQSLNTDLENRVRQSLDNFGLGLSTLGLNVILHNRTEVGIRIRRVELASSERSHFVRLLYDLDSPDQLYERQDSNEEKAVVSLKYSIALRGPTDEGGALPPKASASWLLSNRLVELVRFTPARLFLIYEYTDLSGSNIVVEVEANGSMSESIAHYAKCWQEKAREQKELAQMVANTPVKPAR